MLQRIRGRHEGRGYIQLRVGIPGHTVAVQGIDAVSAELHADDAGPGLLFTRNPHGVLHPLHAGVQPVGVGGKAALWLPAWVPGKILGQERVQLRRPGPAGQGQLDPPPAVFARLRLFYGQSTLKLTEGPGGLPGAVQQEGESVPLGGQRRGQVGVYVGGSQGTAILPEPNQHSVQDGDGRFTDQAAHPIQRLDEGFRVYVGSHAAAFLLVFCFCSSGRTLTVWVEKVTFRTVLLPVARML